MNDPAVNAVHQLIHRATKAETELSAILWAFQELDPTDRRSLDLICAPLLNALIRAEGARQTPQHDG